MTSGQDIVDFAKKSLGVKYVWGGTDLQNGMDCSGLVQGVFKNFGIDLPRTTYNQINAGAPVSPGQLRAGDLVFFATESADQPDHVGIYIGGGKFIEAPHTGANVRISNLDGYYLNRLVGSRRIAGVTGNSNGTSETPDQVSNAAQTNASTRLDSSELAQQYGLSYAFFQTNPELMGLLNQAVEGQWSPSKWTAELKNTDWWKQNSDTQRQAKIEEQTDPATFKARMEATKAQLKQQAVQMGAVISDNQLDFAARNVIASGWQDAQIKSYLGNYINFVDGTVMGGQAQQHYLAMRDAAYRNGVAMSDQAIRDQAAYIGRGLSTLEQSLGQIRQQAMGAFPAYAQQIAAGQNMTDIAAPYVHLMAQETGQNYNDINPLTSQIKDALNRRGQDGQPNPMSLSEFQQSLRSDPAWRQTQTAQNEAMQTGRSVLQMMGLVS